MTNNQHCHHTYLSEFNVCTLKSKCMIYKKITVNYWVAVHFAVFNALINLLWCLLPCNDCLHPDFYHVTKPGLNFTTLRHSEKKKSLCCQGKYFNNILTLFWNYCETQHICFCVFVICTISKVNITWDQKAAWLLTVYGL